jgi:hypothetical protein
VSVDIGVIEWNGINVDSVKHRDITVAGLLQVDSTGTAFCKGHGKASKEKKKRLVLDKCWS